MLFETKRNTIIGIKHSKTKCQWWLGADNNEAGLILYIHVSNLYLFNTKSMCIKKKTVPD